jgi:uncharacterized membrane protein YeaQ/YmgE (transglycosylase-associated protein family)
MTPGPYWDRGYASLELHIIIHNVQTTTFLVQGGGELMGFVATIIVGLLAGWLASMIMKTGTGLVGDLIVGVIGGFLGGFLSQLFMGVNLMSGVNLTSILTALVGAIVLLAVLRVIRR